MTHYQFQCAATAAINSDVAKMDKWSKQNETERDVDETPFEVRKFGFISSVSVNMCVCVHVFMYVSKKHGDMHHIESVDSLTCHLVECMQAKYNIKQDNKIVSNSVVR